MSKYAWVQEDPFATELPPQADEPTEKIPIGDPTQAPIGIYLSQEAAHFIDTFIQVDPTRSLGGILVGYSANSDQRPFILITGAIEAKGAVGEGGELRFVSSTWQYIHEVWNREYPDTFVVGWFRSKPGGGVLLTEYDQFTHHRLFNRPWHVSFIIDPIDPKSSFHCWLDEHLVPIDSFYLWNPSKSVRLINTLVRSSIRETAAQDPSSLAARRLRRQPSPLVRLRRASLGLILIFLLGSAILLPWVATILPGTKSALADAQERLQVLSEHIDQAKATHATLQSLPPQTPDSGPSHSDFPENTHYHTETPTLTELPKTNLANQKISPSSASTASYTVEQGDTLWEISHKTLGDPHAYRALAEMNEILNPDLIYPGMQLRLESE